MSERDPIGGARLDIDPVAAGAGLLFVVLGVVFLFDALGVWDAEAAVVLLVIGLGLALLAGALRGSGRAR